MLITLIGLYSLVFVTVLRSRFISSAKPVRNYRGIEGMNGRLMVIRPGGDEASGLLRTSQFITWSLGGMLNKVERLMGLLIAISMILTYVREGSSKFEWLKQLLAPLLRHADRFDLDPIVGGLLVTTGTIVVLMAVQWLAVSFDRVGWFAEVEMLVEESPAGMTSHAVVLEPQGASRGYVHTSIYNRSQTLDEIASWVKQKVRAPVEPALT